MGVYAWVLVALLHADNFPLQLFALSQRLSLEHKPVPRRFPKVDKVCFLNVSADTLCGVHQAGAGGVAVLLGDDLFISVCWGGLTLTDGPSRIKII